MSPPSLWISLFLATSAYSSPSGSPKFGENVIRSSALSKRSPGVPVIIPKPEPPVIPNFTPDPLPAPVVPDPPAPPAPIVPDPPEPPAPIGPDPLEPIAPKEPNPPEPPSPNPVKPDPAEPGASNGGDGEGASSSEEMLEGLFEVMKEVMDNISDALGSQNSTSGSAGGFPSLPSKCTPPASAYMNEFANFRRGCAWTNISCPSVQWPQGPSGGEHITVDGTWGGCHAANASNSSAAAPESLGSMSSAQCQQQVITACNGVRSYATDHCPDVTSPPMCGSVKSTNSSSTTSSTPSAPTAGPTQGVASSANSVSSAGLVWIAGLVGMLAFA